MADEIISGHGAKVTVLQPRKKGHARPAAAWAAWALPRAREGDYLKTLQQWGSLPEVLSVPNAFRLLQAFTGQNPAALARVLEEAIAGGEIKIWGLGPGGASGDVEDWRENYVRVRGEIPASAVTKSGEGDDAVYTLRVEYEGTEPLQLEATGVRPRDVVALLQARGRKIPDELRTLVDLPLVTSPSASRSATERALSPDQEQQVVRLYDHARGRSVKGLSEDFGVSRKTIDATLRRAGVKK